MTQQLLNTEPEQAPLTIHEFQPLAIRTLADCGSLLLNSIHMTLGIGSEMFKEVMEAIRNHDMKNLGEELGDTQWFAVSYCHLRNIPINSELIKEKTSAGWNKVSEGFFQAIGHLQELDKNELAYGKVVPNDDETRIRAIHTLLAFTEVTASEFGIDLSLTRAKIIAKLRKRFPDKFTKEAAINRNTEAEQAVL